MALFIYLVVAAMFVIVVSMMIGIKNFEHNVNQKSNGQTSSDSSQRE